MEKNIKNMSAKLEKRRNQTHRIHLDSTKLLQYNCFDVQQFIPTVFSTYYYSNF